MAFDGAARVTAVLGPTNTGKTHYAVERMLAPPQRRDRPAAAAPRPRGLRPHRRAARPLGRGARHRRGAHRAAARRLLGLHRRGDAGRHRRRLPRRRRDPALRRPRPRPHLHRPAAQRPRPAPRRCSSAPRPCAPRIASLVHGSLADPPRALLAALLHRRAQAQPDAAAERRRRLLGRGRLRHRRAPAPAEGRRRRGDGRALAAHPQRPGRALPERRRRPPGRDRRHRHGAEPRHQPRRLLRPGQVRRPPATATCAPNELAQIAGRAGRYTTDGTFGVTGEAPPLEPEVVEAIESHRFRPLARLQWRNSALDFATPERLVASLEAPADHPDLQRAREADDLATLKELAQIPEVRDRLRGVARHPAALGRLPDPRLPQGDARRARQPLRAALPLPARRRRHPDRLAGAADRAHRPNRRRHRRVVEAAGIYPHMDLRRAAQGLGRRRGPLARRDPCGRRPAVGCAARCS